MATVDKNFKVKNGLVVEGTTATVDGSDIITEDIITGGTQTNIAVTYDAQTKTVSFVAENGVADSTTDDLEEGSTNKYFTDQRAVDAVVNCPVDTDDSEEGTTNLYFTDQRAIDAVGRSATSANTPNTVVKRDGNGDFAAGTISANGYNVQNAGNIYEDSAFIIQSTTGYGLAVIADQNVDVTSQEDATLRSFTGNVNITADQGSVIIAADSNAYYGTVAPDNQLATRGYVTGEINALDTDAIEEGTTNLYFTNSRALSATSAAYDPAGSATTAENNAKSYADSLATNYDPAGSASQALSDANGYTDTAVANLVDSAPDLLNTLNELAAAIGDDANFVTTITTGLSEKVAKAGDTMTGELVLSGDPTNVLGAAPKQYVDQAETDAVSTAANYTDSAIETGDATATPIYQALNVNDIAKQVASTVSALGSTSAIAYTWAAADYRTAKFLVKVAYGTHTEVSEVLLTLDTSNNIAITEYAIVGTNGSLATVSATTDGTDVDLIVTPGNDSTITVYGTLLV